MADKREVPLRARIAVWIMGVLGEWINWLSAYAQPQFDADWEADAEAYKEHVAYDAGLHDAYDEGYRDAENEWRDRGY